MQPVYLLELSDVHTGELDSADVTRHLGNALEQALNHLRGCDEPLQAEVRRHRDGRLEGIGFFTREHRELLCAITVYYLEHDLLNVSDRIRQLVVATAPTALEQALNRLLTH